MLVFVNGKDEGNPLGRLRGSRNKLSEAVICALLRDFSNHPHPLATKNAQPIPAGTLMIRSPAIADGAAQKVTRLLRE